MGAEAKKESKSKIGYILIPILVVVIAFIVYTLIQYLQWSSESSKDIEWSEKDINIG
jgi:flagellar basal body-associated protein FliL